MAKINISFTVLNTNEISVTIQSEGFLFGKGSPFFYGDDTWGGVCLNPSCREDQNRNHKHTAGITAEFHTVQKAVEWAERIIREAETSQAVYLATQETLKREIPPDREVIIPE